MSRTARIADYQVFNTRLDYQTGPITNQKSSGRCWLFASTNVLRYDIAQKLKIKDFELSQVRRASHMETRTHYSASNAVIVCLSHADVMV